MSHLRDGVYRAPVEVAPCPLDRLLRGLQPGTAWGRVRRAITTGKVWVNGQVVLDVGTMVEVGAEVEVRLRAPRPRAVPLEAERIVFSDAHVIVLRKPAGISTVPFADEQGTLEQLLQKHLNQRRSRRGYVGVVHRLDKETSGLLVFALNPDALRHLKNQFRHHTVARRYLGLVHGHITTQTIRSRLVVDRGDGRRGSTNNPKLGRAAITHVRAREHLPDATFVECRLETGRTHQIRIHLAEAGHPLLGERVYMKPQSFRPLGAPRVLLHATELGFEHPVDGQWLSFEEPLPADFTLVLARLRDAPSAPRL